MARSSGRLSRFLKSSVDALLAPAEDPRTVYADPAQQHQALLDQLGSAKQRLSTSRERLEARRAEAIDQVQVLDDLARQAVRAGRDDQARLALRRQRIVQEEIDHLDRQVVALQREEAQLAVVEQRLHAQMDVVRSREQMAEARRTAAAAQVAVSEALSGARAGTGTADLVERIERDADALEARAGAIEELISAGIFGVDTQLGAGTLDERDAEIEARLAALRSETQR